MNSFVTTLIFATAIVAQEVQRPQELLPRLAPLVPIHTLPADPTGGTYGMWTAGPDFKASFHDGFVFYPRMGEGKPNRPLRWTTASVTAGGRDLLDANKRPAQAATAWRYTYDFGNVVEAYDVSREGIEQTFVLEQPVVDDVVIRGRIRTDLQADMLPASHQAVVFTEHGQPLVSYGAATAVDALGQRLAVTTAHFDDWVELRVPGAWLAGAAFPVIVDPLLTRVDLAFANGVTGKDVDIGRSPDATSRNVAIAYAVTFAAGDDDVYVIATQDGFFATTEIIYADVATWGSRQTAVGYSQRSRRWVVAFTREFATTTAVRAYVHDLGSTNTNGGTVITIGNSGSGVAQHSPDVGGSGFSTVPGSPRVLVTFASDNTTTKQNTSSTAVFGQLVDSLTVTTAGAPFALSWIGNGPGIDQEAPRVTTTFDGTPSHWAVVWQRRLTFPIATDWSVSANKVDVDGTRSLDLTLDQNLPAGPAHSVRPDVSGGNGRFMATFARSDSSTATGGSQLVATRFDYGTGGTVLGGTVLADLTTLGSLSSGRIAQDLMTGSHWVVGFHAVSGVTSSARFQRIGNQGQLFESGTLFSGRLLGGATPTPPAVVNRWGQSGFLFAYGTNSGDSWLHGQELVYPSAARAVAYGSSCGSGLNRGAWAPLAGSQFWPNELVGALANRLAVLTVSLAPANTPLDFLGMTGCTLNVDLAPGRFIVNLPTTTDAAGRALFLLPLLDVDYSFYTQWSIVNPGSNPLGVQATAGLQVDVRR
ncbi:MAG: hypothetical protein R3F56_09440 [Planctomycetota bacterium]